MCVRHAQADMVGISLVTTEKEAVLTIHDNGNGITMDAAESSGSLGIIGMRERAMSVNGRMSIRGVPGQGTTGAWVSHSCQQPTLRLGQLQTTHSASAS